MGLCFSNEKEDFTIVEPKPKRPPILQPLSFNSLYKERTLKISPIRNSLTAADSGNESLASFTPKDSIVKKLSFSPSTGQSSEADIEGSRKTGHHFKMNKNEKSVLSINSGSSL